MAGVPAWLAVPVLAAALLWPALVNGAVPLLFPDSLDYLTNGRDLLLGVTRPPGYAWAILPLWRPLGIPAGLWAVVAGQAVLSAWLVRLTFRTVLGSAGRAGAWTLAAAAPLACASSLPFLASWIMADALSAPTLLAASLLAAAWAALTRAERAGLLLLTLVGAASHQTHAVVVLAAGCVVGGLALCRGGGLPALRGPGSAVLAAVLAVVGVIGANQAVHGHADTAQASPSFLLARLIGDDLVAPHAGELCAPRPDAPLCRRADWLSHRKVDEFLWQPDSPIWLDYHGFEAARDDARALAQGTLRREWRAALANGLRRALHLLVSLRLPEMDLRPMADPMMSGLAHQVPVLLRPVGASRQLSGALAESPVLRVAPWAMLAAFGLLAALLPVLAWQGGMVAGLGWAVVAGMVANAAVVGLTAEAYDRYQARLAWLPMLVLLAWGAAGFSASRRPDRHPVCADRAQAPPPGRTG